MPNVRWAKATTDAGLPWKLKFRCSTHYLCDEVVGGRGCKVVRAGWLAGWLAGMLAEPNRGQVLVLNHDSPALCLSQPHSDFHLWSHDLLRVNQSKHLSKPRILMTSCISQRYSFPYGVGMWWCPGLKNNIYIYICSQVRPSCNVAEECGESILTSSVRMTSLIQNLASGTVQD